MTKKKDPKDLKNKSKHNAKKAENELPEYVEIEQKTEDVVDLETGEITEVEFETENLPAKRNVFKRENTTITYVFTDEERMEKSKQLAQACTEKQTIEDMKKEAMSEFKFKIDGKQSLINLLSSNVSKGWEHRTVTADVEMDYDAGKKKYWYDEKLYDTVKMSQADYQMEIEAE